jgi:hypothetical protein
MIWNIISVIIICIIVWTVTYQQEQFKQEKLLVRNDSLSREVESLKICLSEKAKELDKEKDTNEIAAKTIEELRENINRLQQGIDAKLNRRRLVELCRGAFDAIRKYTIETPTRFRVVEHRDGAVRLFAFYDDTDRYSACLKLFNGVDKEKNLKMASALKEMLEEEI